MPLPFARQLTRVCTALLLACALPACSPTPPSPPAVAFQGRDISGSLTLQDFTLTDHNGQPRKLSEFRGKPVAVYFGYTHCPDVCPTTLAELAQSMRELGPQADQVQVLFITIDPARDTQALLKSYAPAFDPRFIGLTGSPAQIASVAGQFRALYRRQDGANGDYTMDHSAGTYLLDRDGKLRVEVPYGSGAATFTHDLRALLQ
ncbi:SCO family protein [Rivihabitans pingtungensis]|uniref:SCO family protein n=1 Tax=Rivihabitans pingtungensis TaxID=1054498 RepID=UPI0023539E23|nr:SCO family protein [Rivihabitans pingtungensis]MCK6438340.1 SCO family protein [Rivihabitans pingtungensis]